MFRSADLLRRALPAALLCLPLAAAAQTPGKAAPKTSAVSAAALDGLGRAATPAEIKAWDIDVRPDLKGLPPGKGTVMRGQEVWDAQCASCHGVFGESNEVFTPIIGGTTKRDMETGRAMGLIEGNVAQRTTMMKLSTISTLWDYINRAMPWTAPKTLSTSDVYAVTAYILHMADMLPPDGELSDKNMAEMQAKLPNRNAKTQQHGMWLPNQKPDVSGSTCMRDCVKGEPAITSQLPAHARDAHGNLAEQMRGWGPIRGADTTKPPITQPLWVAAASGTAVAAAATPAAAMASDGPNLAALTPILNRNGCMVCHGADRKIVGPSFREIGQKYKGRADAVEYLKKRIAEGGSGVWGQIPMPAQPQVSAEDLGRMADWMAKGAP